ncbi:YvrJ family protein [Pullulanibacillus sp. KACC 23026]|uniref:YvrJ family protein n=1 Tax=Pullulanibacillus sp. KACC 23026 TaxID=3028315 RepID=UPI0023B0F7AA|nr:YvrJ family protein [Pullulanibacillus sp. KACC 23026]WEG11940.1 YvrJ family protein [Pullulanibacillus sp. KACC 23026]
MNDWVSMIKDVGFPIVVTLYLLYRIEGKLDELNTSIQQLPGHLKDWNPSSPQ